MPCFPGRDCARHDGSAFLGCAQAESALAAASVEAVALKAQVIAAVEQLAEQRSALAAADRAAGALARQACVRGQQIAALADEAAKARCEYDALERDCARLQQQRQQEGSLVRAGGPTEVAVCAEASTAGSTCGPCVGTSAGQPTMLEYMRIRKACSEASKRVADWQRKLEVQVGRRVAAAALAGY